MWRGLCDRLVKVDGSGHDNNSMTTADTYSSTPHLMSNTSAATLAVPSSMSQEFVFSQFPVLPPSVEFFHFRAPHRLIIFPFVPTLMRPLAYS